MALAALAAFAAGAGVGTGTLLAAGGLILAVGWQPPEGWNRPMEQLSRGGILLLCAWMLYVAFVLRGDFMPAVLGMLLFLLVAEALRPLGARNDMRLYSLSFALLVAASGYYPGPGFAAAFAAYVGLAAPGMMVGFLRRQAEGYRAPEIRLGRRFLWATAGASAIILAVSVVLFLAFPRLPRQWNVQGRDRGGAPMAGYGDGVSLGEHGSRLQANPEVAFRVEFPDGPPPGVKSIHWRGRSYDRFDGVRWTRSRGLFAADVPPEQYARRWGGERRRMRIFGGPPGVRVLFGPHPVLGVQPGSAIRAFRDGTGDFRFRGGETPVYTVLSGPAEPPADVLGDSPYVDPPQLDPYLRLPPLPARVRELSDSLAALSDTRLGQVRAVERHLRSFRYTLDLPETAALATLDAFLFRRRAGHCEYFSTAMAILLRAQGIPARNVTGFLGGEWNAGGGYLRVAGNDAHSWVEVWFPDAGWVTFDPTPPAREGVVDGEADGWTWPLRFWFDGVEYRWYRWVIDYNVDRQLAVFGGVGEWFSRAGSAPHAPEPATPGSRDVDPGPLAWAAAALLGAGGVAWWARGRRRATLPPEARGYLALRRAYARAGWGGDRGPLEWAEELARAGAPGAEAAGRAVDLYLRARFSGRPAGAAERGEMERALAEARARLRAERGPRGKRPAPA